MLKDVLVKGRAILFNYLKFKKYPKKATPEQVRENIKRWKALQPQPPIHPDSPGAHFGAAIREINEARKKFYASHY